MIKKKKIYHFFKLTNLKRCLKKKLYCNIHYFSLNLIILYKNNENEIKEAIYDKLLYDDFIFRIENIFEKIYLEKRNNNNYRYIQLELIIHNKKWINI